ncbi:MAG: serine hydrolase domain-containing protein [Pseudomonadota bacterium]
MRIAITAAAGITLALSSLHTLQAGSLLGPGEFEESGPSEVSLSQELEGRIEKLAQDFPGMSLVVRSPLGIVTERHFGFEDIEEANRVGRETRFNLYSVSKLVTGYGFAAMASSDRQDLSTELGSILPHIPSNLSALTLRQLLTHSAGIRHYRGREDWIAFAMRSCSKPSEAISYFEDDALLFEPGTERQYSTFGYVLLSAVLMGTTGVSDFEQALADAIGFEPGLSIDHAGRDDLATGYLATSEGFRTLPSFDASCKFGGGGLVGSADQLARFGVLIIDNATLDDETLLSLLKSEALDEHPGYAFGAGFGEIEIEGVGSTSFLTVGGGAAGGRGYLMVLPELDLSIALAANAEGDGEKVARLVQAIAREVAPRRR